MKREIRLTAAILGTAAMALLCACAKTGEDGASDRAYIEETLNLANQEGQAWTYAADADAWALSPVPAVAYPELPEQQGVSVCVPGAYVTGIDTNGDGEADVTAETASGAVNGSLVIDYDARVTSTNGQVYTAATAPVIFNTGAAGYGSQSNQTASSVYAADGYINVFCGNRGKQDSVTDEDGNTSYTGDAPSCLADQKAAVRYVKYNILLGNLPGNGDYLVSTGGSGGGAHAVMLAATSDHPDYYDYQIEAGAVGVYQNADGSYSTSVTIDGQDYAISDGAWGCLAYSAITSLYEADMALAFEYDLDPTYSFKTPFQKQLAAYLSESYREYINGQDLSVEESGVGFDLDGDGKLASTVALTIEYDPEAHPETNGYYGTYLDLYLAEFTQNLQWYLDQLDYAQDWTWFDEDGSALSDDAVAAMTGEDKARAFLEGRCAKSSADAGGMGGGFGGARPGGNMTDGDGMAPAGMGGGKPEDGQTMPGGDPMNGDQTGGNQPDGNPPEMGGAPEGGLPGGNQPGGNLPEMGGAPDGGLPGGDQTDGNPPEMGGAPEGGLPDGNQPGGNLPDGREMVVGTPDGGTTQSATGSDDAASYASYADMVASYREDLQEIEDGDRYGNNMVSLYNPLNYIGADGTSDPVWAKIVMGAAEGDMSMFSSLNLQIAWLNAGVDADIEWQWDGGHVPSEILGNSFSLCVDQMYGTYVEGAAAVEKAAAVKQTANGTAQQATGTDISGWVSAEDTKAVSFTLSDAAAYRTKGASKAMPGFDVIDYGQEDYVFGSAEKDARHWDAFLLRILEEHADTLEPLFAIADGETAQDASGGAQAQGGQTPPALPGGEQPGGFGGSGEVTQGTSACTISDDGEYGDTGFSSSGDDENALRIDGAAAVLDGITVEKSAGASSNTEDGDFYGMNAALLATNGAAVTIRNAVVRSAAQNGNGVFSYGDGTTVTISDSEITTTADHSGGIQTTGGGTTRAFGLTVETSGNSSAAIRSDRGGGIVDVDGGSYTTNGYNSPAVYSTAAITVKNAALTARNSEALVIEGGNSITLEDCTVTGHMSDTKGSSSDENVHNVMIYQSMSGDADVGTSEFSMTGGTLTSENGDLFYVTNTRCALRLCGVKLVQKDSGGSLLNVSGNSASHGWGTAGANGGQVELTADDQSLSGDIVVDTVSSLHLTLSGNSQFTGTIQIVDNAQGGETDTDHAVVTIERGSVWTLTGDCTLTSLENHGTIDCNGYTITLASGETIR